jgi:hypothetical protein
VGDAVTVTLNLPSPLLTLLEDRATLTGKSTEVVAAQLLQFIVQELRDLPPGTRLLSLSGPTIEALEQILGGGSLLNAADLQKKVERLAGISFLHCRLPFTPNQLEQLGERAARQGMTVEQLVNRTAPRIYEHFFNMLERTTQ